MIKLVFFSSLFLISQFLYAVTPSRYKDGKIEFAIATVGKNWAFTEEEKNGLIALFPSAEVVVNIQPSQNEIILSTCVAKFENYTEFAESNTKAGSRAIVLKLKKEFDALGDQDSKAKWEWLKSYRDSLPEK